MPSLPWSVDQIAAVRTATFPMQRGGYAVEDVERQLDRIALNMERGGLVPEVAGTALRRVPFFPGAAVDSVDGLLRQVRIWQEELVAELPQEQPSPTPQEPSRAPQGPPRLRWTAQQVDWVRDSRFSTKSGRRAYVEHEVDDFLDKVLVAMGHGDPLPDIESVLFYPPRRGSRGYDALQVDEFLDQLARLRPLQDGGEASGL